MGGLIDPATSFSKLDSSTAEDFDGDKSNASASDLNIIMEDGN